MEHVSTDVVLSTLFLSFLAVFTWAGYLLGHRRYLSSQCLFCDGKMQKMVLAMQAVDQGVVVIDLQQKDHPVIYANAAFLRQSGLGLKDVVGKPFEFMKGPETDRNMLALLQIQDHVVPQKESVELKCYNAEGHSFWARVTQKPIMGKNYIAYLVDDIENEKDKQWQSFQAQKMESLGMLAGGIAHDFNNVLSIIEGNASMVASRIKYSKDEKLKKYTMAILEMSDRGAVLTRQLLAFGKQKIVLETKCNLIEILKSEETFLKPLLGDNVNVSYHFTSEDIWIKADKDLLWQIMINLASNARDAMNGQGLMEISAGLVNPEHKPDMLKKDKNKHDFAYLTVSDTGCGMPDHVRKRVFEPFYTTKESGKGTGLGLSVVYGLVKQMQGYVDIETAIEQGTRITVYLPLVEHSLDTEIKKEITRDNMQEDIRLRGKTILTVDDEKRLTETISDMAQSWGMTVLSAHNADEALVVENEHAGSIDFLLTDIAMPGVNGFRLGELFQEVRPDTHILYMSGYTERNQFNGNPASDEAVMLKPVRASDLKKALLTADQEARNKNRNSPEHNETDMHKILRSEYIGHAFNGKRHYDS